MDKTPQQIISEYMSELGKKGGAKNKAKGSEYFKMMRNKRTEKNAKIKSLEPSTS